MGKVRDVSSPTHTLTNEQLINMLHERGVTIEQIFGQYYAIEEMGNAQWELLTVGDVELAGLATQPDTPINRQPF